MVARFKLSWTRTSIILANELLEDCAKRNVCIKFKKDLHKIATIRVRIQVGTCCVNTKF